MEHNFHEVNSLFDHFIVIGAQLQKAQVDMNVATLEPKIHLIQF
jgi:hypothetical protein